MYYFKYADGHLYSVPVSGGAESSSPTRFVEPLILHISPDGSTLLVQENTGPSGTHANRLWLLPTNGGTARPLGDIEADSAAWSPDGKTIAFARGNTLYLTQDEGASYRRLADSPGEVQWIRWSPDGQRMRFSVLDLKTRVSSTWEADRSGKVVPLTAKLGMPPYSPDFNPIEKFFSKLKGLLRKAAKRSIDALWKEIGDLLNTVTPGECSNFFTSGGYVNT